MKNLLSPSGMTIRELKDWVNQLPDKDKNGEDREVWVETGVGLSSPAIRAWPLNSTEDSCDIILGSSVFDEEKKKGICHYEDEKFSRHTTVYVNEYPC